ncbi:MAG TPA: hypothetical protein VLE47_04530, partial [Candidatus Saccharimonadales bacterium]|nr:hypothetical protein [Candidatus Saccharimonadales bacterium]
PPGEEYDPVSRRKARIIQIVAVIILVLFLSLFFGFFGKRSSVKENKANTAISSAESNLNEAESLKATDPTQALTLVESANKDLEEAKKKDPNNSKIEELENKSSDLEAEINKTNNVSLTTLFDFSKLKKGAKLDDAAQLGSQILLVDREGATTFSLDLGTKNGLEVSGSAASPQTITSYPAGFYLTNLTGINKLDTSFKVTSVGNSANWGKIQSSATYQNNLYLLDPNKGQIWKYVSTSQGLGTGKAYVTGDKPDLSSSTAMAIDAFVWVIAKNGTIYKFAGGANQNFTTSGLSQPISEASDIFTNSATKNLYILDTGSGRVVVLDKSGSYLAAYSNSTFKKASLILVDESQKIAYVGVGEKLYSFKLP